MQQFLENVIAGGAAGVIELLCMYPLDVVKTRMQLQQKLQPSAAAGAASAAGQQKITIVGSLSGIVRERGMWGLYRGIGPPLSFEPLKRAVKFSANAQYKKWTDQWGFGARPQLQAAFCGLLTGITEGLTITPAEVVKVRMQASNRLSQYKNSWDCARAMFRSEGISAFTLGWKSAMCRNGIWNMTYFGLIPTIKSVMPQTKNETARNFVAGVIGGTAATTLNNPFDVVLSRARNVAKGEAGYNWSSPIGGLVRIWRTEGFLSLYKGFLPKVLRLGPGGGIMLVVFNWTSDALKSLRHREKK